MCSSDLQLVQGPADVDGAKKALRSGNPDDIGRALDELQQAYSAAGASLYAATRGASGAGAGGGPGGGGGAEAGPEAGAQPGGAAGGQKDNVVEADYEIVDDDKSKKT